MADRQERGTRAFSGKRSYVAVLFSDLSGSTGLAADIDTDSYVELLGEMRREGGRIVKLFGGDVAQVYGDGTLSLFQGANGVERAIEAALMLHAAVAAMPLPTGARLAKLQLHSGIHSGLVLLRDGDAASGVLEAVGLTTAVAARLSAAARPNEILVSAGSLGPGRDSLSSGPARKVDIGNGSDPVAAVPVSAAAATDHAAGQRFPFVGRAEHLAAFSHALDAFLTGEPLRFCIMAPAGQGKSRLAAEFSDMAARRGAIVVRGACSAATAAGPLQPFRQILAMLAPSEPPLAADLRPDAIVAALTRTQKDRPTLLVLDDWQWADSASVAVLALLLDTGMAKGLLLLSRETEAGIMPQAGFAQLRLPPLTLAETTALVRSRRPELDPLDAARVHVRAGGNPLYVEELCLVDPGNSRAILPSGSEPAGTGWLASLVAARAEQLDAPALRLLQTAAVIGIDVPRALLEALVDPQDAATAIPALLQRDFLVGDFASDSLRFRHGITWEILYSLVPLATRKRLHADIAEVVDRQVPARDSDRHETLAWHFMASDQPGRSWGHAEQAGDRAATVGSLDRARLHYRLAIETIMRQPPAQFDFHRYAALIGKFGFVCIFDADRAQFPVFEEAIRRAEALGDRGAQAAAEYWLGYVAHGSGDAPRAIQHCEQALALSDQPEDSAFKVQVRATLGQAYAVSACYAQAAPLLDEAIAIKRAHRSGSKASVGMAYTLIQRAALLADTGDFVHGRAMAGEALDLLSGKTHPVEASIMAWIAAMCAWQADWDGMQEAANRGCAISQRIEAVYIHAICRAFACFGRWKLDASDTAAEGLTSAVECMVDRGKSLSLSIACGFLAEVQVARGNAAGARWAAARAFERARLGDPMGLAWAARAWARAQAERDAPERAKAFLQRARANATRRQSPHETARCDLEEARLGLVRGPAQTAMLARATDAFDRMDMPRLADEARLVALRLRPAD